MKKKEIICNECQLCDHSAKEYLYIKNKFTLQKAMFCLNVRLSAKEKQKRMKDKVKCEHFKLAQIGKEEQLSDIAALLENVSGQLCAIKQKLADINGTKD